jgi:membrane protease YdiL (CAAX protease family)
MINVIPAIVSGGKWIGFTSLLWNIFFYLIVVGLQEELVFRGFILTRLHGAIKSEVIVAIVCGLMFALMHVPYQLFIRTGGNIAEFFTNNLFLLLTTFAWHFLFYILYRKYNSLTAPTLCHFLMNFSNTLFR